ncbi:hypothetical protein, partial [Cereibacter johrii]|uniref:hypothetical protein n=1 Tax=Cereibacter johrii TaxID=445629 RepID=UPI003CF58B26
MSHRQDSDVTGSGNTVVQIVGDGNAVSIVGAQALRLLRYDQAGFTSAPVKPGKEGEPGFTETGRRETAVLSAFNRESLPFQGRGALLGSLTAWRDGAEPVAVHAITGGGGRGKTRLALRIMDEALQAGWTAGFVRKDDLDVFLRHGCRVVWTQPTLVIVDYAAAKSAQLRNWLHGLVTEDLQGKPPLRILLLERIGQGATWWRDLFEEAGAEGELVQDLLAPDAPQELRALDEPAERHAVFAAAYGAASGRDAPAASEQLDHALRAASLGGEPLFLAMFGLVAARQGLEAAKAYPADRIAVDLAREELKRIGKVWEARGLPVLADRPLHAHLAAAVSLAEGLTEDEAHGVIAAESAELHQAIPAGQTGPAFAALRAALEGEDGGIAPILPDILGEAAALVALGGLPDQGVAVIERLTAVKRTAVTSAVVR